MSDLQLPGSPSEYGRIIIPNIEIVGARLLIYPKPKRSYQTDGGIIVPPTAQENTAEGVVVLTGDGITLENGTTIPPRVEQGDAIIYARYAGTEIQVDKETFLIIQESEVRAILTYKGKVFQLADDEDLQVE